MESSVDREVLPGSETRLSNYSNSRMTLRYSRRKPGHNNRLLGRMRRQEIEIALVLPYPITLITRIIKKGVPAL
jgi:hypothetical protein